MQIRQIAVKTILSTIIFFITSWFEYPWLLSHPGRFDPKFLLTAVFCA
jgi:hypothetical protein